MSGTQAVPPVPKKSIAKKQYIYEDVEMPEDLPQEMDVADEGLVNVLLDQVEKYIPAGQRGVKFEDVISIKKDSKSKGGLKESKKRSKRTARNPDEQLTKKTGLDILAQEGGNDPRLERDFKK